MTGFLNSKRGRIFTQNLTAYLFILPAFSIIFVFGIFPVAFAFFVSLHEWLRFPEAYSGLAQYGQSLGNLAYILFFWLSIGTLGAAVYFFWRLVPKLRDERAGWFYLPVGALNGAALVMLVYWFFTLLPFVLNVPERMPELDRSDPRNRTIFIEEFFNSFTFPDVTALTAPMMALVFAAIVLSIVAFRQVQLRDWFLYLTRFTLITFLIVGGGWLLRLTVIGIDEAVDTAKAAGDELPIWPQVISISFGAFLIFNAYLLWQRAVRAERDARFFLMSVAALSLIVGGYVFITQLPLAVAEADDELMQGFWVTVMYVIGTVPIQLTLGLGLAYLLFNAVKGKSFFRMMYFLPYITPFAATSVVFATMFSGRENSIANRAIGFFGLDSQGWVGEPRPIFEIILGTDLPQLFEGPGLALVVIMIWATWTYVGYDAVIFMAGLGNISSEYYEAARIDGANGWSIFRNITLPLLSPTTFFLSLIAVIGTFQAFTQIWMMRQPAAFDAVDTVGVYIYVTITDARPENGYGAAMAFVLFGVILLITIFQNRILSRRVFYG